MSLQDTDIHKLPDLETQWEYVSDYEFGDEHMNEYMKANVTMFYNMYKHGIIVPEIPPYYVANYQWDKNNEAANTAFLQCIDEMGDVLNYSIIHEYASFLDSEYDDYQGAIKYYDLAAIGCSKYTYSSYTALQYCLYAIAYINTSSNDVTINLYYAYLTYSDILFKYKGDIDRATHYSFMAFQLRPSVYMYYLDYPLIQPKPYIRDIRREYIFRQSPLYRQWHSQRKIDNTLELYDKTGARIPKHECAICYCAPPTIYRYACVIHTYCKDCYCNINQCSLCQTVEHPMYKGIFVCI
jgi:hypothetical protein